MAPGPVDGPRTALVLLQIADYDTGDCKGGAWEFVTGAAVGAHAGPGCWR